MKKVLFKISIFLVFFIAIPSISSYPYRYQPRLSIVDWTSYNDYEPQGPGTYAFGYDVEDPETNNVQFRDEERFPNGTVIGSYGYVQPDGNVFVVRYVADERGYRATIEQPKGQLKPVYPSFPSPIKNPSETTILTTALQSQQVYKNQKVHEIRTRPIDQTTTKLKPSVVNTYGNKRYLWQNSPNEYSDVNHPWLFDRDYSNSRIKPENYYFSQ